ncbi:hypothetical protein BD779DRAFT_1433696 [Infundibulicybe gibba]|nr:hypothetical protein BD779DRAFT_1433696 [Infundibulicybe gibba]
MSRVELAKIRALTFYQDEQTAYRRTSPLPQLVCRGDPCRLYTPEVVRCENLGGSGTNVDWKCQADLPSSLRFGRVEVSCEGYSKPGDPYVLKDSCSLEYRLVQVPKSLRHENDFDSSGSRLPSIAFDFIGLLFTIAWIAILCFIVYKAFLSCLRPQRQAQGQAPQPPHPDSGGSGWFPGGFDDSNSHNPPPPYSKSPTQPANRGWQPGFWTGTMVGGVTNYLFNRQLRGQGARPNRWDWEQSRTNPAPPVPSARRRTATYSDRGEGSSNLGAFRQSTGLGGSNVR